ncbi:hypothetical protein HKX42_10260 [Salinisphaera sp. USBA-960]|uniref:LpxL/LpxP family acyltransferase n=1 Tax=Salinisphaera orenii TaxID=856731 RepID=UPI000DBEA7F1|nr:hypothetical protein [Salifodinibacter halophilus]NNC27256.1 hypothetical protein [Salifodinibacter halophilus]
MAQSSPTTRTGRALIAPKHWPSWLILGLGRLIAASPSRVRAGIGRGLGAIGRLLAGRRKQIATTNFDICFPDTKPPERDALLRRHFHALGDGVVETTLAWWGSDATVDALCQADGFEHLEAAATTGRGVILMSAHFTPLALGVRVAQRQLDELGLTLNAMYKAPADPVIDRAMQRHRGAHMRGTLISHNNVQHAIERLKCGEALWFAGDQKAGQRLGVAADFFGRSVQTHVSIFRIARLTRATLLPYFIHQRDDGGYQARFLPPLADVPSRDEAADAARVNALIETEINAAPAQYFWLHRRFRRPEFDPYADPTDADQT